MMRAPPKSLFCTLICLSLALTPLVVTAEGWAGFYTSSATSSPTQPAQNRAPGTGTGSVENICLNAIFSAQQRHGIPDNLLLAIGLQEAGMSRDTGLTVWPWSVNAAGEGRQFDSRQAAMNWVSERQSSGVDSIDVGCMQINLRWHPEAFSTLQEGFDPLVNVDYAARFLVTLKKKTGDWMEAAGSYHSFNPEPKAIYLSSLRRNVAVANDRLAYFAQAANAGPVTGTAQRHSPTANYQNAVQPAPPSDGVAWSSWLTKGQGNGRRSIYSTYDLQPILPVFYKQF